MTDSLRRVAALVAYDGSDFRGFQVQHAEPTVQGALEAGLRTFTSMEGRISGAGRTDTGVHARGQVVMALLRWKHDLQALQRAWNAHLPDSVVIRRVRAVAEGFHPRFSAESRTYRYFVVEHVASSLPPAGRSPLSQRYAHYERSALNLEAMQRASARLVGTHDFATFGHPPQGENTVRTVIEARWQRIATEPQVAGDAPGEGMLAFEVTANAFLQHMVRKVVGSLLCVGRGQWSVTDFEKALAARDGRRAAPPAAPCGLILERVNYSPSWGIDWAEAPHGE